MSALAALFLCVSPVVVDGDTLRCANVEDASGRVRLARIDAPERGKPGSEEASEALRTLIVGPVECRSVDADPRMKGYQARDRYGRVVAKCSSGGLDLGQELLRRGLVRRWP